MRDRIKRGIDQTLDAVRFRLDTFPELNYQPLPWLGRAAAPRAGGFYSRWEAIRPIVEECGVRTAVDIGCNVGAFSISLARAGVSVIGIEDDPTYYRTALYAKQKLDLPRFTVHAATITPESVFVVPEVDCVLFLSVWHHLVRHQGFATATDLTRELWRKTKHVLFFETGQREMSAEFGLPAFEPDPVSWLKDYLQTTCENSVVEDLGLHDAFTAAGGPCTRTLFAVRRTTAG